jgi:hypothetical protein
MLPHHVRQCCTGHRVLGATARLRWGVGSPNPQQQHHQQQQLHLQRHHSCLATSPRALLSAPASGASAAAHTSDVQQALLQARGLDPWAGYGVGIEHVRLRERCTGSGRVVCTARARRVELWCAVAARRARALARWLRAAALQAVTLPASWYTQPAALQLEKRAILFNTWQVCACCSSRVAGRWWHVHTRTPHPPPRPTPHAHTLRPAHRVCTRHPPLDGGCRGAGGAAR